MPEVQPAISYSLRNTFQQGILHNKIIFFSAGAGWGKTAAVKNLLERRDAAFLSLRKNRLPGRFAKERLVVLDDLQALRPQDGQQLQTLLQKAPQGQRFILLSRGPLPEPLAFYEAAGALLQLGPADLALDIDCLAQLVRARDLRLSICDLRRIREETEGCPTAVNLLLLSLSAGKPFQQALQAMYRKMGAYLNETALLPLEPKARQLLAELSLFNRSDVLLAEMLTGDKDILSTLETLRLAAGLIRREGDLWQIADQRFLLPYLRQNILAGYPADRLRAVHLTGGRWYARRQDLCGALYHYRQAGSRQDILDILSQNARRYLGTGACYAIRDYYDLLTEDELRSSPDMICTMSMLRSMAFRPEESEKWYEALKLYIRHMDRHGGEYRRARGLQAYLDLALPHRGTEGLSEKLPAAHKLLASKSLTLPEICVTGCQPSLLRGGKDFSQWLLRDPSLLRAILPPAEEILGRSGVGLTDLALAEILLEQSGDISGQLPSLAAWQEDLRSRGTPEMQFVLTALLVRALSAAGDTGRARELLLRFRGEAEQTGAGYLLPNIDAMRCRLSLLENSVFASVWFSRLSPKEEVFLGTDCYRYLTKARCCIQRREHHAALLLLGQVLDCTRRFARPLDMLETLILIAVCRFRMEGGDWQEHLAKALEQGGRYGYTAVFTREGAALLPLLEQYDHKAVQRDYWKRILSGTVVQAGYCGQYLQPLDGLPPRLTQTETMILRLISQDKSNEAICSLLDIQLPTAKTHVRNIFRKLKVTSRAEAKKAAKRMGLI